MCPNLMTIYKWNEKDLLPKGDTYINYRVLKCNKERIRLPAFSKFAYKYVFHATGEVYDILHRRKVFTDILKYKSKSKSINSRYTDIEEHYINNSLILSMSNDAYCNFLKRNLRLKVFSEVSLCEFQLALFSQLFIGSS